MRIVLLTLFAIVPLVAYAQETTTELGAVFTTTSQEVIDLAVCLKSGQRCNSESLTSCYIDGLACEEILEQPKDELLTTKPKGEIQ